jgi:hypothetical protein
MDWNDFLKINPQHKDWWNQLPNQSEVNSIWENFVNMNPQHRTWWNQKPGMQLGGRVEMTFSEPTTSISNRFNCEQLTIKIAFGNTSKTFEEANNEIQNLFTDLHSKLIAKKNDSDKIRLVFHHDSFQEGPIRIPFLSKNNFAVYNLINNFKSVTQSYKEITMNNNQNLHALAIIARIPQGSGKNYRNQQDYMNNSSSILNIYNNDNMCGLRAIIVAIAHYEKSPDLKFLLKNNSPILHKMVLKIMKKCKIIDKPLGIGDIKKIERYFKHYQITILHGNINKDIIYKGIPNNKHIYICFTNSHYNVITSMKRFMNKSYYCNFCKVGYDKIGAHKCEALCISCLRHNCIKEEDLITDQNDFKCEFCKMICRNLLCKSIHEEKICYIPHLCQKCNKINRKNHVCGMDSKWCRNCKKSVNYNHECYILKENHRNKEELDANFIFFDYECYQLDGKHIPNLIIAEQVCKNCINNNDCKIDCGIKKFYNNIDFCLWLFDESHKNFTAIAHNMKSYDGIFILKYIVESFVTIYKRPEILMNSSKILCIKYKNVRIIDSLSFLPMPLENFAKTFDLKELKKGFFPHKFNTQKNQNYVGKYPSVEAYQSEFFTNKKKLEFEKWYDEISDNVFDFKKELEQYCLSDVKLLKEGCLCFRKIIKQQTSIDPLLSAITIASLCHLIFRKNMMVENSIAVIPQNGYNPEQNTSIKAFQWLKYISVKDKIYIKHAKNGGEIQIGPYLIDGYSESIDSNGNVKKTLYEFHGCFFHGCPKCFNKNTWNTIKNELMSTTNTRHNKRMEFIKNSCKEYNIIEFWEHEFDQLIKNDLLFRNFIKNCDIKSRLNPRDSLFGGRTNALKLHHKCKSNEKIKYVDFTSLYPYVQKYCKYPIGHPKIITENFKNINEYFGIIKCKIIPPKSLYIPVLPARINGKLIFTLCNKCAYEKINNCDHCDEERLLDGTWVSEEIKKAIEKGYKIDKIYEIWHWDLTELYDSEKKTGGLFTFYIDTFLKGKQEASGFPDNISTEKDKENYINDYYENEGILLDKQNIKFNSGMRSVTKLMLNSFWGRYAMNSNKMQVKFISKINEWYELITDDKYEIHDIDFTSEETVTVFYKIKEDFNEGSNQVNVVIASFVTAYARLKLYSELEKISNRVIYFDTDSIIYISNGVDYEPKLGDYLGELTNEIDSKNGNHIVEIICAGPKNYAYELDTGFQKCVIKGFTLNYISSLKLNFSSMKDMVLNNNKDTIKVDQLKFIRDKSNWNIQTGIIQKLYSFVYDKRIIKNNLDTMPYGYIN